MCERKLSCVSTLAAINSAIGPALRLVGFDSGGSQLPLDGIILPAAVYGRWLSDIEPDLRELTGRGTRAIAHSRP